MFLRLFFLLFFASNAFALEYRGKVVAVIDGDTIKVLEENKTLHKIRLYGIDAPEKKQPFGSAAKYHLSQMIFGKIVDVQVKNIDRYGREVAEIIFENGDARKRSFGSRISANRSMIMDGYAWAYVQYLKGDDRRFYTELETDAKKERLGLWQDSNPTPPWNFRKSKKRR